MDIIWDGITRGDTLHDQAEQARHALADAGKRYDWQAMLGIVGEDPRLINTTRPDGKSWYAPLHQAAHGGAPVEVVERLLEIGAFRTLRTATGERPCDIADRRGHGHLRLALDPVLLHEVPEAVLGRLQAKFHAVIRKRAKKLVTKNHLRLPELEPLLEQERAQMWFAVPGMYGGFSYELERAGDDPVLVSSSWCRVVDGSEQKHVITRRSSELMDEGFV